jgi:hypothetical protein
MKFILGAALLLPAVLASSARAQEAAPATEVTPPPGAQPPPPPPPAQPPPPPPPAAYPPPPDGGPPYGAYAPPGRIGVFRPFSIGLGLGPGLLSAPGGADRDNDGGLAYLVRLGFGVTRDWMVNLGLAGTAVSQQFFDVSQTNYTIGAQYFILRRLFARAGLGLGTVSEDGELGTYSATGQALEGGVGFEVLQGYNVALALEWAGGAARFSSGTYLQTALGLSLSLY